MAYVSCAVCFELMTSTSIILHLPCGHAYHDTCLNKWLKNSKSCPDCRKSVKSELSANKLYLNFTNETDNEDIYQQLNKKVEELAAMKGKLFISNSETEKYKEINAQLKVERDKLNNANEANKQMMRELTNRLSTCDIEKENSRVRISDLLRDKDQLKQLLAEKETEVMKLNDTLVLLKKLKNDLVQENTQLEKDKVEITERLDTFRNEFVAIKKQLETQELANEELQTKLRMHVKMDKDVQSTYKEELEQKLSTFTDSKKKLEVDYADLQAKYKSLNASNDLLKSELRTLHGSLHSCNKKIEKWKKKYCFSDIEDSDDENEMDYGKRWRGDFAIPDNLLNDDAEGSNIKLKFKKSSNNWTIIQNMMRN